MHQKQQGQTLVFFFAVETVVMIVVEPSEVEVVHPMVMLEVEVDVGMVAEIVVGVVVVVVGILVDVVVGFVVGIVDEIVEEVVEVEVEVGNISAFVMVVEVDVADLLQQ